MVVRVSVSDYLASWIWAMVRQNKMVGASGGAKLLASRQPGRKDKQKEIRVPVSPSRPNDLTFSHYAPPLKGPTTCQQCIKLLINQWINPLSHGSINGSVHSAMGPSMDQSIQP
jgi:hypothetical protein